MFHLIPAPLHRGALRLAHFARKRWWRLTRAKLLGVAVIALDGEGRVLLVRHHYGSGLWTLPGGGLRPAEDPRKAALREFREELGCGLNGVEALGVHRSTYHGAPIKRFIFRGRIAGDPRPDGREVAEARFFAANALPPDSVNFIGQCIEM